MRSHISWCKMLLRTVTTQGAALLFAIFLAQPTVSYAGESVALVTFVTGHHLEVQNLETDPCHVSKGEVAPLGKPMTFDLTLPSGIRAHFSLKDVSLIEFDPLWSDSLIANAEDIRVKVTTHDGDTLEGTPYLFPYICIEVPTNFIDSVQGLFPKGATYSGTRLFDITSSLADSLKALFAPESTFAKYQDKASPWIEPSKMKLSISVPIAQLRRLEFHW